MTTRVLAMTVMVAVLGGHANAQELASDLSQLRVKPGDVLTVTDTSGERVQGRLTRFDNAELVIELQNKQQRQFDAHTVSIIEKRDSKKNGALIGFAIGGILGGLTGAGLMESPDESVNNAAGAVVGGLMLGGIGAAIGTGIDAANKGQRVIYTKSKITVSVAPVMGRDRKGVVFTLRR
jgi:hypothetical protein